MADQRSSIILTVPPRAILHDPKQYPEPEEFKPERFLKDGALDPSVKDPDSAAFGFGRRYIHSLRKTLLENRLPKLLLLGSVREDT